MSFAAQLPWLLAAVFLVGTPHGALDGRVARTLMEPEFGRRWLPLFLLLYLAAAGTALGAWLTAPLFALAGFLLLATVHFGSHDAPSGRPLAVAARGALPPVVAAAAHPEALATIFGWLAGPGGAALLPWLAGPGLLLWLCAVAATLAIERNWPPRAELTALTALFVLAPPLLAFAAYFALVHTPRALAASKRPHESWSELLAAALPFTAAAVALAGLGYVLLRTELAAEPALVRTTFWWLGALTVPHMALGAWVQHRRAAARHRPVRAG